MLVVVEVVVVVVGASVVVVEVGVVVVELLVVVVGASVVVVDVVEVVVVDEHANAPHVNAQLTSPTSHCAILRASPILQASSPFTSQTSG